MAKFKKINITKLQVNTENYRFEPVASQKEAIDIMIDEQGEKLFNLAKHIVENGLNPNDKIQVMASSHDPKKYNVVEGNRRIVSLKLLSHPDLIDNKKQAALKKKFKKLNEDNKLKLVREIECMLYDSPVEADKWIKLKHGQSNGVGTVPWNGQQVQRFEEKVEGKSSIALQVINLLKKSPDVPSEIIKDLPKLPITNLDRMLADREIRNMLGLEINNGIIQSDVDEVEVIKGLTQVAKHLLDPKFSVKKIYTKEDRKDYIAKFPKASKPNIDTKAIKPWQLNNTTSTITLAKQSLIPTPKALPKDRNTLIPKTCVLSINNPKVNAIYYELQKLDVSKYTNAAAVLYRVFIELSMDCYLERHKLTNALSSAKSGTDFQQKVFQIANHLESIKKADAAICKGIKVSIKDRNDVLGLDTWHAYVHNNKFSPTAGNLIITWDGMQEFMIIMWNNIN